MALDEALTASGQDRHILTGSGAIINSPGSVQRGTRANLKFRRCAWPSRGILAVTVAAADFCALIAAAAAVFAVYFNVLNPSATGARLYLVPTLFAATLFVIGFERLGGYRLTQLSRLYWQLTHATMMWGVTVSVLLLAAFFGKMPESYWRGWTLAWSMSGLALILIGRGILQYAITASLRTGYLTHNLVIVGAGNEGQQLIAKLQKSHDKSIAIRGVFDDRTSRLPSSICGLALRGTTDDLLAFARQEPVDEVIIALPLDAERRLKSLCDKMKAVAVDVRLNLEPLAETFQVRRVSYVGDVPILELVDRPLKNWRGAAKFIEDKLLGSLLLALLSPVLVLIAVLIKLDSRGPVFFIQTRFGFNNEVIPVLKFRTMHVDCADPSGAKRTVRNDPRVTRLGRILRVLSFDELPQLINVVRGDMSLVGPRPHAIAMKTGDHLYCEAVEQYLHRHRVKPGITGWAQVRGLRGEVDTLEKARARVAHDLHYIENWSLLLDLKILLKTVATLIARENAY